MTFHAVRSRRDRLRTPLLTTHNPTSDGVPVWTHDSRCLAFASNRGHAVRGETNVFVVDSID